MSVVIGFVAYALLGLIVLESLRIWTGLHVRDGGDLFVKWALWPLLLCIAPFMGNDQ